MVDPVTSRRLGYWSLFLAIWLTVLLIRILPVDIVAGGWPGPNWTIILAFAWVLRRPSFVPVLLVAITLLLDDMVFLRPPGLFAGLSLVGLEFLRSRAQFSRELPFLFEWSMVASVIFAIMITNRLIMAVFALSQPALQFDLIYFFMTTLTYPLIVMISSQLLGVRQVAPGQVDQMGHPI